MSQGGFAGIGGVLFDAVGTLMEPHPSVAAEYTAAARRQGVALDPAEVRDRFRRHFGADEVDELRGPLATDEATEHRRWRRLVGLVLAEVPDPERAFAELWDHFARPDAWRTFPDVGPAVRALAAAGVPMRIASNWDGRLHAVARGLPALGPLAEAPVISSEVGYRKPHPQFYLAACDRLGLPPHRVLCVGDDPENDLNGPRRAGLRAALVERSAPPDPALPRYPGLEALVSRLLD